ncbi:MAG: hypothetical protein ACM3SR_12075 [Ignavibacteriales bacterium]
MPQPLSRRSDNKKESVSTWRHSGDKRDTPAARRDTPNPRRGLS